MNSIAPYLTQDNITAVMVGLGWLVFAIRQVIKFTTTKKDDEILAQFDEKTAWIQEKAHYFYDIVQELSAKNVISKEGKFAKFFDLLGDAYREAHKTEMPGILKTTAQVIVEGRNAVDKAKSVRDDMALQIEQVKAKIKGEIGPNDEAQN